MWVFTLSLWLKFAEVLGLGAPLQASRPQGVRDSRDKGGAGCPDWGREGFEPYTLNPESRSPEHWLLTVQG